MPKATGNDVMCHICGMHVVVYALKDKTPYSKTEETGFCKECFDDFNHFRYLHSQGLVDFPNSWSIPMEIMNDNERKVVVFLLQELKTLHTAIVKCFGLGAVVSMLCRRVVEIAFLFLYFSENLSVGVEEYINDSGKAIDKAKRDAQNAKDLYDYFSKFAHADSERIDLISGNSKEQMREHIWMVNFVFASAITAFNDWMKRMVYSFEFQGPFTTILGDAAIPPGTIMFKYFSYEVVMGEDGTPQLRRDPIIQTPGEEGINENTGAGA